MKMPFLLISPKIVPKIQLIKKGGCFEYHAVIADKIKYRYVHRASICPALGMDRRSFFMPKPMGKYKRLEVFYLSKPVYTADKPSDCHYCYFWTNGRKGCRLGRNNCYYHLTLGFVKAHPKTFLTQYFDEHLGCAKLALECFLSTIPLDHSVSKILPGSQVLGH